jgi:hypothetical protein
LLEQEIGIAMSAKARLVRYKDDKGGSVIFEVDEIVSPGMKLASADKGTVQAAQTLEEALNDIEPVISTLCDKLRGMVSSPQQVNIELGLKFTAAAGIIIAKVGAEGHCKVSLTWTKK